VSDAYEISKKGIEDLQGVAFIYGVFARGSYALWSSAHTMRMLNLLRLPLEYPDKVISLKCLTQIHPEFIALCSHNYCRGYRRKGCYHFGVVGVWLSRLLQEFPTVPSSPEQKDGRCSSCSWPDPGPIQIALLMLVFRHPLGRGS
jgi:hypothetical protein